MTAVYLWAVVGVVLVGLELVASGLHLYWVGIGCFAAAITAAAHGSFMAQVWVLVLVSAISIVASQRFLRHIFQRAYAQEEPAAAPDAVIGQQATVIEGIDNVQDRGAVQIGERIWEARSLHGELIPPESVVIIRRMTGARVFVELP